VCSSHPTSTALSRPDSAHRSRTRQAPTSSCFQPLSAAPSPFPLLVAILTYRHIMEQPTTARRSMIHSALALFAQRTRIPTSARSIGFCVIWVCISSSSRRSKRQEPSPCLTADASRRQSSHPTSTLHPKKKRKKVCFVCVLLVQSCRDKNCRCRVLLLLFPLSFG